MIRAVLSAVVGDVPRLIMLAIVGASVTVFLGFGAQACWVAAIIQAVWATLFVLTYLFLRTIADIAGVLRIEEAPRD